MPRKRSAKSTFHSLLESDGRPIYVLDAENNLLFANRAMANWLKCDVKALIGQSCCSGSSPENKTGIDLQGLGISQEVTITADSLVEIFVGLKGQAIDRRKARLFPLSPTKGDDSGWLVFVLEKDAGLDDAAIPSTQKLRRQLAELIHNQLPTNVPSIVIGQSVQAQRLRKQLEIAIQGQVEASIIGPVGSEAEYVAKYIFGQFADSTSQTLSPIYCGIADQMLIQETMRRIARNSKGYAEHSQKGFDWLLLLDVDRLSPAAAMELDGFLEMPKCRVKALCTASIELRPLAESGQVPPTLAARFSTFEIKLAALQERRDDLPLMFQFLVETAARELNLAVPSLPQATLEILLEYAWPNNTSELREAIDGFFKQAKARQTSSTFLPEDFPERIHYAIKHGRFEKSPIEPIDLTSRLDSIEREFIERALARNRQNKTQAAKSLGISRARLLRRCEQLAIEFPSTPIEFELEDQIEFGEAQE